MKVTADIYDFWSVYRPWSGAIETAKLIEENDKIYEFFDMMNELYPDGIDIIQLNDILWFESEWILDILGIKDGDDDEE